MIDFLKARCWDKADSGKKFGIILVLVGLVGISIFGYLALSRPFELSLISSLIWILFLVSVSDVYVIIAIYIFEIIDNYF